MVAEDSPINDETQEETPARQDVDVLLDVSELEVDRIKLTVRDLRAHVSVVAELASLVSLQVGVRAILKHALDTVAEHPEILTTLTRALEDLVTGRIGDALGTVENVLGGLGENGTVDELLKGRLEDVRDTLQEVLSEVGEQTGGEGIA